MKNNLRRLFMSALMAIVATITATAQCYIIGIDGQWRTDKASATLQPTATAGVYEGDVTFSSAPNNYFAIASKLTETDGQWAEFNANRYAPETPDALLTLNTPMTMVKGRDASYNVAADGTYRMRVDFNAMTVTLLGTYPDELYIWGSDGVYNPTT